jgi:hypothetical protein
LAAHFAALVFMAPGATVSAALKEQPNGIYDILTGAPGTGQIDLTTNPLIDNPNLDGFRYKVGWAKIQPDNAATFKWDSIDAAIAVAAAHGKKLCISIASGFTTPGWAYTTAPVVYKYVMLEKDQNTGLSIGSQPLPWDTAFQDKWLTFLAAFGARYENNPACSYVVIGGFMQVFNLTVVATPEDDAALNALAQLPPAGYPGLTTVYTDSSAAYIPAAQRIISAFVANFPTTPLILTLNKVFPGDIGLVDQNAIDDWAKATYPGQLGSMVSALYATLPPHGAPSKVAFPKGFQMVCATSDAARVYIDPDPVPLPPAPIPLQDALEHGVTLGGQYVEVYQDDLVAPESQSVMATERVKLADNILGGEPPPKPLPPKNLHVQP